MYDGGYGGGVGAGELVIMAVVLLCAFAVAGLIGFLLFRALEAVPAEHRKMQPWQVFLIVVPCFGLFWSFLVFTRIPQSSSMRLRSRRCLFSS